MLVNFAIVSGQCNRQAVDMVVACCEDHDYTAAVVNNSTITEFVERLPRYHLELDVAGHIHIIKE